MKIRFELDSATAPIQSIHVTPPENQPLPAVGSTVSFGAAAEGPFYVHSVTPDNDPENAWAYLVKVADQPASAS